MTTDTKAVARWSFDIGTRDVYGEVDGPYVLFTDHERVVGELIKAHEQNLSSWLDQRQEIDKLRAELDALNETQAVGDGTISGSLLHWHQRALAAEAALAASRAEVEGFRAKAARYDWVRTNAVLDGANGDRLDAGIDAAMEKGNV